MTGERGEYKREEEKKEENTRRDRSKSWIESILRKEKKEIKNCCLTIQKLQFAC
jgi:hypothetical protein